jgi:hypothetical protein
MEKTWDSVTQSSYFFTRPAGGLRKFVRLCEPLAVPSAIRNIHGDSGSSRLCVCSRTHESMAAMKSIRLGFVLPGLMSAALFTGEVHVLPSLQNSPGSVNVSAATQLDGSHDFDFLIGDWKAHVRRLPERLKGSNVWVEYDGISNHKKLLDSNANFEEFDVSSTDRKLRIKAQTLRLYNPESHQWSIYLVDLNKGTLDLPPVVGQFY